MLSTFVCIWFLSCTKTDETVECISHPATTSANVHYTGNRPTLQPLHFVKLPVGSIKPEGWIKEYLNLQRDGLSGHLGEISAWLQKDGNAWLSVDGKGDYGWEEVPYWLKGYADMGYILNDADMIAEAKT
jgi:hypothetical protein